MKASSIISAVLCTLSAILLSACDAKPETKKDKPQGVIPEYQLNALEKAKEAKSAIEAAKAEQEKALKEQGLK